jgi:predicted metal-dependent phosphoesterase TrpH
LGYDEARRLGAQYGVTAIPGVEFSAYDYTRGVRAHILGYGMRDMEPIEALGAPLLRRRHENSLRQIGTLRRLGYDLDADAVAAKGSGVIYKQHIMHVMVERGYARSIGGDTFRSLFKGDGPCAFDIEYLDAQDAIAAIRCAGGVAVLAHPGQQGNFGSLRNLVMAGLQGLELYHHANSVYDRTQIAEYAHCYGLLLTGGSDHHGLYENNSPAVGDYLCPAHTMERLMDSGAF